MEKATLPPREGAVSCPREASPALGVLGGYEKVGCWCEEREICESKNKVGKMQRVITPRARGSENLVTLSQWPPGGSMPPRRVAPDASFTHSFI